MTPPTPLTLVRRLQGASEQLFSPDDPLRQELTRQSESLAHDLARLDASGRAEVLSLALVGKVGEGKTWLARCFLDEATLQGEIGQELLSGQNSDERTPHLRWVGPHPPVAAQNQGERFLRLSSSHLLDLGEAYVLGDGPGFSDQDPTALAQSTTSLAAADLKILCTSASQLRDRATSDFLAALDGSLILPVVRYQPTGSESDLPSDLPADYERECQRWKTHSPHSRFLEPLYLPEADRVGPEAARQLARRRLRQHLAPVLQNTDGLRLARETQQRERLNLAHQQIATTLQDFRNRFGPLVERLEPLTAELPTTIEDELIGEQSHLQALVRSRLRSDLLERCPIWAFPFRSLLGVLALTFGAWDRLIFASLGSVPSLISTAIQSGKNLLQDQNLQAPSQSLQWRLQTLLRDNFRTDLLQFRHALSTTPTLQPDDTQELIEVRGLTTLEADARELTTQHLQQGRLGSLPLLLVSLLSSLLFWGLLAGPLAELYQHYLSRLLQSYQSLTGSWESYPAPGVSVFISSLWLSLVPALLLALLTISAACSGWRVRQIARKLRQNLRELIAQRLADQRLQVILLDPKLEAARDLLSLSRPPGDPPA